MPFFGCVEEAGNGGGGAWSMGLEVASPPLTLDKETKTESGCTDKGIPTCLKQLCMRQVVWGNTL